MSLFTRIIVSILANLAALWTASYLIQGFYINPTVESFLSVALLLTAVGLIIKPILKLILSPLIIITLGLFTIIINAALLFAVDIFSASLDIQGLLPLIYVTLLITASNMIFGFWGRRVSKKD